MAASLAAGFGLRPSASGTRSRRRLAFITASLVASQAAAGGGGGGPAADGTSTWGEVETPEGLSLSIEAVPDVEAGGPATIVATIRNDGTDSEAVALDPRLADLRFRSGHREIRCDSPDPDGPLGAADVRWEEIAAGGSASLAIDPRYHCWTDLERFASSSGGTDAEVSAVYHVVLMDPAFGRPVGRAGDLDASTTAAIPADGSWGVTAGRGEASEESGPFSVEARSVDATRGSDVWLTLTVRNRSGEPVKLVDHPTQFRFEVLGPTGARTCSMGPWRIRPISDLLVRLGRRGKYVKRIDLSAYCPEGTFDEAGVYRVEPTYDPYLAESASEPVWDTPIRGRTALVRIRRGGGR